jgi:hypothetical protein
MNVDRSRDPLAIIFGELLQRFGNDGIPTFRRCDIVEVGECTFLRPVGDVEAEHLNRSRRVFGGDAGAQNRHRLRPTAAGNRHVLPTDTLTFQVLFQDIERGGLAARRPPVKHFHIAGIGQARR